MIEATLYTFIGVIIGLFAGLFAGYTLISRAIEKTLIGFEELYRKILESTKSEEK